MRIWERYEGDKLDETYDLAFLLVSEDGEESAHESGVARHRRTGEWDNIQFGYVQGSFDHVYDALDSNTEKFPYPMEDPRAWLKRNPR